MFLVALFVWRVTAPLWRIVRWPVAVSFLIAFAAAGSDLGDVLDVGRIFQHCWQGTQGLQTWEELRL